LTETGNACAESDRTHFQKSIHADIREAEILLWISRGKSQPRHRRNLEHQPAHREQTSRAGVRKTRVENRAAAAAAAVRALAR